VCEREKDSSYERNLSPGPSYAVEPRRWSVREAPSARPDVEITALGVSHTSVVLPIFLWGKCLTLGRWVNRG